MRNSARNLIFHPETGVFEVCGGRWSFHLPLRLQFTRFVTYLCEGNGQKMLCGLNAVQGNTLYYFRLGTKLHIQ